ncbi:MAG: HNH endonuclease [Aulosira sp. ZfuVER01]|nr:HNH endonuclease [Aulosira sp. ZfuVER01]MDZ8000630.1 HNH endonuclease [Aulosira sp. DedVER01a]MDZ8051745.1 HNH endonuclease [Aulosira sp. ZfuCHP01]
MRNERSEFYQTKVLRELDQNYQHESGSIYKLWNYQFVMPRYSQLSLPKQEFRFGITKGHFDKFKDDGLFILFICDTDEKIFVLPVKELLWLGDCPTVDGDQWKLHIKEKEEGFYLYKYGQGKTKKYISQFLNNFRYLRKLELFLIAEEVTEPKKYYEGATTQIMVNTYERNSQARKKCLATHGLGCYICGFNFARFYGDVGKDFIQIHHLKPLSEIKEEYEVDPIKDLRPVCPNCHAMIHMRKPPYTREEILYFINTSQQL